MTSDPHDRSGTHISGGVFHNSGVTSHGDVTINAQPAGAPEIAALLAEVARLRDQVAQHAAELPDRAAAEADVAELDTAIRSGVKDRAMIALATLTTRVRTVTSLGTAVVELIDKVQHTFH